MEKVALVSFTRQYGLPLHGASTSTEYVTELSTAIPVLSPSGRTNKALAAASGLHFLAYLRRIAQIIKDGIGLLY